MQIKMAKTYVHLVAKLSVSVWQNDINYGLMLYLQPYAVPFSLPPLWARSRPGRLGLGFPLIK